MYKLEIQDLHKSYGAHQVLKGVSLQAKAGDVISLIGSSGSGKSTFLRCINLLEQPSAGSILLNGEPLKLRASKLGSLKAADPKQLQR
ncbi:ATP-binding cassette domain-containing protein, partial [Pseudomonas chlororaphis]